jgi:hypothetical protein
MWGKECNLSPKEYVSWAFRYLEPRDRDIWKTWAARMTSWSVLKGKAVMMYPGSNDKFSASELEILVETQAASPIKNIVQFGEYH